MQTTANGPLVTTLTQPAFIKNHHEVFPRSKPERLPATELRATILLKCITIQLRVQSLLWRPRGQRDDRKDWQRPLLSWQPCGHWVADSALREYLMFNSLPVWVIFKPMSTTQCCPLKQFNPPCLYRCLRGLRPSQNWLIRLLPSSCSLQTRGVWRFLAVCVQKEECQKGASDQEWYSSQATFSTTFQAAWNSRILWALIALQQQRHPCSILLYLRSRSTLTMHSAVAHSMRSTSRCPC